MDAVDERRAAAMWSRIHTVADDQGAPVQVRRACMACARSVDAFGAGLSLICADAVLMLSLDGDGLSRSLTELLDAEFIEHRAQVHQAAGMMSVQLGVGITDAMVRLRAHAYTHDRPLAAVATDIVARRLRFPPDQVADDPPTPNGAGRKDP